MIGAGGTGGSAVITALLFSACLRCIKFIGGCVDGPATRQRMAGSLGKSRRGGRTGTTRVVWRRIRWARRIWLATLQAHPQSDMRLQRRGFRAVAAFALCAFRFHRLRAPLPGASLDHQASPPPILMHRRRIFIFLPHWRPHSAGLCASTVRDPRMIKGCS